MATRGRDTSLGLPTPAAFSALTLNSYFLSSDRSLTLKVVSLIGARLTGTQRPTGHSLFSTMYPVTVLPPSDAGGSHDRVIDDGVISETEGGLGASGTPDNVKVNENENHQNTKMLTSFEFLISYFN